LVLLSCRLSCCLITSSGAYHLIHELTADVDVGWVEVLFWYVSEHAPEPVNVAMAGAVDLDHAVYEKVVRFSTGVLILGIAGVA
jgi:hypothetical protein